MIVIYLLLILRVVDNLMPPWRCFFFVTLTIHNLLRLLLHTSSDTAAVAGSSPLPPPSSPLPTQQKQPQQPVATPDMCVLCFDVLLLKLHQRRRGIYTADMQGFPIWQHSNHNDTTNNDDDDDVACPLFVTWEIWHARHSRYELRGCIGNLSPATPLTTGVPQYAAQAAFQDRRFTAVTVAQVPALRCKVSLLVRYEACRDVYDWTVGVHGITIVFWYDERRYSATYLPEVAAEQGWNRATTISSLIQKAGYAGPITPAFLRGVSCTRYQSSRCAMTFAEYVDWRQRVPVANAQQAQALLEMGTLVAAAAAAGNNSNNAAASNNKNGQAVNCCVM